MSPWQPFDLGHIDERVVHVIQIDLGQVRLGPGLDRDLIAAERQRLAAFRRDIDRDLAQAGRWVVRRALGFLLGCPPSHVPICEGAHGKPELATPRHSPLRFNVSHSGQLVLVALAHGREVGVDVERFTSVDLRQIASAVFSPAENEALDAFPRTEQTAAFFRCWARKEAIIKAEGTGFLRPTTSFTVSLDAGDARVLAGDLRPWWLTDLPVLEGHAAALAVEGEALVVRLWDGNGLVEAGGLE